jgi:sarcosine oxidase delta subunit
VNRPPVECPHCGNRDRLEFTLEWTPLWRCSHCGKLCGGVQLAGEGAPKSSRATLAGAASAATLRGYCPARGKPILGPRPR